MVVGKAGKMAAGMAAHWVDLLENEMAVHWVAWKAVWLVVPLVV